MRSVCDLLDFHLQKTNIKDTIIHLKAAMDEDRHLLAEARCDI